MFTRILSILLLLTVSVAVAQDAVTTDTVTIDHDEGSTEVPLNPERVVVIGEEILELAWVLDMPVVGLATGRLSPEAITSDNTIDPEAFADSIFADSPYADVTVVGSWTEPNLEAILALQPDLIIRTYWGQEGYDRLSVIAPTLSFSQVVPESWQAALREMAKIVEAEARADEVIEALAEHYTGLEAQLRTTGVFERYPNVLVLAPFTGNQVYMYTDDRIAAVMRTLGFGYAYPEGVTVDPQGWTLVSEEVLVQIDADTLVVAVAWDTFEGKEQSLALIESSDAPIIRYQLERMSPWTGPIVDRQVADAVAGTAIERTVRGSW
ncbi:MAG: ABC transporter substrate-binding protein [Trueperaceae bacterium]|nr:ABC transporter substrate-binding protein [Trueperaceae bacterium]